MPKIITFVCGGIGNQLFIYAAARRLALVHDAELVLDDISGFALDRKYRRQYQLVHFNIVGRKASFTERLGPLAVVRRKLAPLLNRNLDFGRRSYIKQDGPGWEPRLLSYKPNGSVYLQGYWQSENYFKDVEQIIRQDLEITPPSDGSNLRMSEKIQNNKAVAIHVRWFASPDGTGDHNASTDYYQRAISFMEEKLDHPHYFLFSDDPKAANGKLNLPQDRVTLVSHNRGDENAYADLWLMSLCKHFIIANSTFSWWGAWLSVHRDKIIISPDSGDTGVSKWGFPGLIPDDWIKL